MESYGTLNMCNLSDNKQLFISIEMRKNWGRGYMQGYIVNTDKEWFEFLLEHKIDSPMFWFKRESNPNKKTLIKGNYVFFRITGVTPPVIKAYGVISKTKSLTLQEAFKKYGDRLGYSSINEMVKHSSKWTSSVKLTPNTKIFCMGIIDFKLTKDIRIDKELEPIGILFDYRHIVTGKGLSSEQTSALLQLVTSRAFDEYFDFDSIRYGKDEERLEETYTDELPDESAKFLETHLQWFVFNNLNCLEISGAKLYDENIQKESQGKYRTDEVGEIDFLLISPDNNLIVVELKKSGTDKTIGQICRYMGWVKHRLAKPGQKVKGIIVTQDYDHRLAYAASVIPDLVVKKVAISFSVSAEGLELPE